MIEWVREFVVKEEERGRFELVYGPGGAWSNLFARCAGFRGTVLLRNMEDRRRYLVMEIWTGEEQREQARREHEDDCSNLEAGLAEWVEYRRELGAFRLLAEATVRGRGREGRATVRKAEGRNRRVSD